jgi:hypothetical protein
MDLREISCEVRRSLQLTRSHRIVGSGIHGVEASDSIARVYLKIIRPPSTGIFAL